jgi:hypothetical protein
MRRMECFLMKIFQIDTTNKVSYFDSLTQKIETNKQKKYTNEHRL